MRMVIGMMGSGWIIVGRVRVYFILRIMVVGMIQWLNMIGMKVSSMRVSLMVRVSTTMRMGVMR